MKSFPFKLEFQMDNAAFEDQAAECARILREIARKIEAGRDCGKIMDANGNSIGEWSM